jgi:hypothetical protein
LTELDGSVLRLLSRSRLFRTLTPLSIAKSGPDSSSMAVYANVTNRSRAGSNDR